MAHQPVGPGSVVADRFRLEELLEDHSGARFWRALDTILSRNVAVHVIPADDPRAPAALTAARTSAIVSDGRILRVLDAVEQDGLVFVVHEWGSGISLDRMLAEDTLDPRRAAWLVREVADAISRAHATGVAHGRLVPENVLITEAGSVKLIGFVVDSVLLGNTRTLPDGSEAPSEHESDVRNLGALLYACLVGRWPGYPGSALPAAPESGGRPLRPRQVRAGVPKPLDTLCDQILSASRGAQVRAVEPRFESATEVADALSRFLGDNPGPASAAVSGPAAFIDPSRSADPPSWGSLGSFDGERHTASARPPVADPDATQAHSSWQDDTGPVTAGPPTAAVSPGAAAAGPSGASQVSPAPLASGPRAGGMGGGRPPTHWGPDVMHDTSSGVVPVVTSSRPGSVWLRLAALVAIVALIVVGVILGFDLGSGRSSDDPEPEPGGGSPTGTTLAISAVRAFDPVAQGGNGEENDPEAARAHDGNPRTSWKTEVYYDGPVLAPYKEGVGLLVDLGEATQVSEVRAVLSGSGYALTVFAAPASATTPPTDLSGVRRVARQQNAGGRVTVGFDAVPTRYVVLWLTALPVSDGGYRGRVGEIVVRS